MKGKTSITDNTLQTRATDRRFDSLARLITGENICAATCFDGESLLFAVNPSTKSSRAESATMEAKSKSESYIREYADSLSRLATTGKKDEIVFNSLLELSYKNDFSINQILQRISELDAEITAIREGTQTDAAHQKNIAAHQKKIDENRHIHRKLEEKESEIVTIIARLSSRQAELSRVDAFVEDRIQPIATSLSQLNIRTLSKVNPMSFSKVKNFTLENVDKEIIALADELEAIPYQQKECENKVNLHQKQIDDETKFLQCNTIERVRLLKKHKTALEAQLAKRKGRLEADLTKVVNSICADTNTFDSAFIEALRHKRYIISQVPQSQMHAEMQIVQMLYDRGKLTEQQVENSQELTYYIGISKLCCHNCIEAIEALNKRTKLDSTTVQTRGKHGNLYTNWTEPRFIRQLHLDFHKAETSIRLNVESSIDSPSPAMSSLSLPHNFADHVNDKIYDISSQKAEGPNDPKNPRPLLNNKAINQLMHLIAHPDFLVKNAAITITENNIVTVKTTSRDLINKLAASMNSAYTGSSNGSNYSITIDIMKINDLASVITLLKAPQVEGNQL